MAAPTDPPLAATVGRRETAQVDDIAITTDTIRLGQLLKLAGLVDAGSDAKILLAGGEVLVNDEIEIRRGRQLRAGDVVRLDDVAVRVVAAVD
ncbi:MAG: RNA-binding S4 domain-containing protein [Acidobacteria bacterium]|nr:RNA-binding S4 domain-containing protein [Acidobacteriota bacterium]